MGDKITLLEAELRQIQQKLDELNAEKVLIEMEIAVERGM